MRFATVLLIMAAAFRPWSAAAAPATVSLQPFSRVRICAPFGALITPSAANTFQISLDADQSVKNAVTTAISQSGVLTIGTSEDFQSANLIRLTVRMPPTALKGVEVNAPITTQVAVAPGFQPGASFDGTLNGSGDLFLLALNTTSLTLTNNGAGNIVAKGNYGSVRATNNGAGKTFIGGGTIGTVTATSGGVGQVIVDPTNSNAQITGSTQLLGKILYTRGSCQITGSNIPGVTNNPAAAAVSQLLGSNPFGSLAGGTCQQVADAGFPSGSPQWTCGVRVQGIFDCSGTFSGGSVSTSGGGSGFSFNNAGGSGGSVSTSGNAAAAAGTPGGTVFSGPTNGQVQFVQQTGPGQTTLTSTGAVQTIPCATNNATALAMI